MQVNLSQHGLRIVGASMPVNRTARRQGSRPTVTTYSLRKAAADKTRTDVVVVGVCKTKKGLEAAPGGEAVASAYGRKFAPLLSTIGFHGKPGEVVQIPTGGMTKSPLLIRRGPGRRDRLTRAGLPRA